MKSIKPGDRFQDTDGSIWHVHDDGKVWTTHPRNRIHPEIAMVERMARMGVTIWSRADLPDSTEDQWIVFQSRFGAFDGYRSPARQHDLYTVFKSGIQYAESRILGHLNSNHPKVDDQTGRVPDNVPRAVSREQLANALFDVYLKDENEWPGSDVLAGAIEALIYPGRVDPVEEKAVAAFKEAWRIADGEGDEGNRTRRGIVAARKIIETGAGQ